MPGPHAGAGRDRCSPGAGILLATAPMAPTPALLSLRTAFTALGLLVGCALAVGLYAVCAVLAGTDEALASGVALSGQAVWQVLLVRVLHGARRSTPVLQAGAALLGFAIGGVLGLGGGSAFFAVATVALTLLPAAGAGSAWWVATGPRRRAARLAQAERPALTVPPLPPADDLSADGGSSGAPRRRAAGPR